MYQDADGRLALVREISAAQQFDTLYTYNGVDELLTIVDAAGNTTNFTWDKLGRLHIATHPTVAHGPIPIIWSAI